MDDEAVRALARRGVVLTEDARAAGLDDRALRTARAAALMTRIRPGAYVDAQVWAAMSDEARYRQTVMAAARTLTAPVFSHYSAAALWGLPLVGRWPESVHVVARGASGGRSWRGVVVHGTDLDPPTDVRDGFTVTDPATTVLGVARVAPFATGLAMADHALRAELTTSDALAAGAETLGSRRGAARARRVVAAADARAESVGE
ncbi:hypothetical protein IC607_00160 [Cellulomonas sp. JH27-2]|uniref:type IV toxin-antitoxin system AbiEi family antitoxin domain-containing protein n=1 Tax=Cellulomonas sp. JH27-2 TaxID=2774139 RepID=UPI00177FF620|nr:type IV toxin-antitoxin system AbiEi family antitoxin domain-containing protein [Cellulomonas sp. JH27-2]MBD8057384.1 hypothetical protein [Cellulomonas sp. JH27-2]